MLILTHVNNRAAWRGDVYSITMQPMRNIQGVKGNLDFLAPTEVMVKGHKAYNGDPRFAKWAKVSDGEYTKAYRSIIIENWIEVRAWYQALDSSKDVTLLCYCAEDKFCHRHLLARYFQYWQKYWRVDDVEIIVL